MDIIDFTEEIKLSVSYNDTQRFITLLLMDIYTIGEKDYNDILPIIKNHDIHVLAYSE